MTFLTQQQEVASRARLDNTQSSQNTLIERWINASQAEIWAAYDWPWARDRAVVQTVIDKTAGTVDVSAGGTFVLTGAGASSIQVAVTAVALPTTNQSDSITITTTFTDSIGLRREELPGAN